MRNLVIKLRGWVHAAKVWWLRRRLRDAYLQYLSALDSVSCGHEMAMQLPRVLSPARRYDQLADMLAAMGENVPTTRLTRGNP